MELRDSGTRKTEFIPFSPETDLMNSSSPGKRNEFRSTDLQSHSTGRLSSQGLADRMTTSYCVVSHVSIGTPTSRKTPVVAPAGRGGRTPSNVELSSSQVRLASKLGITPEQYAAQVVKEIANG